MWSGAPVASETRVVGLHRARARDVRAHGPGPAVARVTCLETSRRVPNVPLTPPGRYQNRSLDAYRLASETIGTMCIITLKATGRANRRIRGPEAPALPGSGGRTGDRRVRDTVDDHA